MILSGTAVGFIAVLALLAASILLAILDRKSSENNENKKSKSLSRLALVLFLASFVGGVVVTLLSGVKDRDKDSMGFQGRAGSPMASSEGSGSAGPERNAIGQVNQEEFEALKVKVAADPKDVRSRERLGHLYLQMQDFENTFEMAHEALKLNPKSAESYVHLGMILFAMRKMDDAMDQFNKALSIDPNNTEALLFKGIVQFQGQQDLPGARKTWEHLLKVAKPGDPTLPRVRMFLSSIQSAPEGK
jgi:tetratricopeptide (TPR) repeat protein